MVDNRIKEYRYLDQLLEYIGSSKKRYIEGQEKSYIYPKQLEIHLPGSCNANCKHCFGSLYKKEYGKWETEGLSLLDNLNGSIKYHIYGGAYTEPTVNRYLTAFMAKTKLYGNNFGLHTNGILLKDLEIKNGFLTNLYDISTDKTDYISISLDAGSGNSWEHLKKRSSNNFYNILWSIEKMAE